MSAKANKKFASHRELFLVGKDAPFSFVEAYQFRVPFHHQQLQNDSDHFLGSRGG